MECHIEQVLYRDQRTIKTRYFENCHQQNRQQQNSSNISQFLPSGRHQGTSPASSLDSVMDDALSIRGLSNSSLYYNCHNQYFSKFKRLLYQTEVQCGCEDVKFSSEVCEKRRVGSKSWLKKLYNVLLLSAYLSLITFPYASAVPTTISSRSTAFSKNSQSNSKESSQSAMNITALTPAYRSAKSAANMAVDLKNKFRERADSDPAVIYKDTPAYPWLPQIPDPSNLDGHLESLELKQTVLDLFTYIQKIRIPIDELEIDYKDDEVLGRNISNMRGSLDNIIEELNVTLLDNNLKSGMVDPSIMLDDVRNLNKTNQALRDWLIIRALVDILEYTVEVFKHFNIPYEN